MDVRCERCRAQYAVDDARVSETGVKVACAQCGHAFLLRKKTLSVTVPLKGGDTDTPVPIADLAGAPPPPAAEAAERGEWRLRQPSGAVFPFRELSTLQRWIVERKATRDDEVAAAGQGEAWRKLGDIPELQSFFTLLDRAKRSRETRPEAPAEAPPEPVRAAQPGLEDPAWARGPVSSTRRVTRSALRPPPRRSRVLWVALIAIALLGVAVGTVYLRRKAESDLKVQAVNEAAAQAALASRQAATVPVPAPRAEPPREPAPQPVQEPAPAAAPTNGATSLAEQAPAGPAAADPAAVPAGAAAAGDAPPAASLVPGPAPSPAAPAARPPPRDDPAAAVRGLLARAREQRDRGRPEAALDLYGQALAQDGRNATALAGRGACYLDLSRYVQAEASFGESLEVDPRNAEALFGLAETNRYMGRKDQAVAFYERFLSVRPTGDDAAAARRLISQLKE
jgi:predicted Zn finger-like uncharacterized protein